MKMLKITAFLLFFIFAAALPAKAANCDNALSDILDKLPDNVADSLPDDLRSNLRNNDYEGTAEKLGANFIINFFTASVRTALKGAAEKLTVLLGVIILASLLSAAGNSAGTGIESMLGFISGICVSLSVFEVLKPVWKILSDTLNVIGGFIKGIIPVMTVIYASSGNVTASAVNATWLSLIVSLIEQICASVLSPILSVCFGFMLITSLSRYTGAPDLSGTVSLIRKTFTVVISLLMAVLTAVMSYQGVIAQSSDTVLLRSVKFASGSFIPVVGGALSEAAGNIIASVSVIKSTAGTVAAVSVILCVLPAFLEIFACRIGMGLISTAAGILGCRREGDTIKEAAGLLDFALAILAVCSAMFIIILAAFARSTVT